MTEKEALKHVMDRLHADYVLLRKEREGHEVGLSTCDRLMAEAVKTRAALLERYQALIRTEFPR